MSLRKSNWRLFIISVLSVSIAVNLVTLLIVTIIFERYKNNLPTNDFKNLETYLAGCFLCVSLMNGVVNYFYGRNYRLLQAAAAAILTAALSFFIFDLVMNQSRMFERLTVPCSIDYTPGVCGD